MIHDLAGTLDVIDRAVLTVGVSAALATLIFVAAVVLITGAVTGTWTRTADDEQSADCEEAA